MNIISTPSIDTPRAPRPESRDMTDWLVNRLNENSNAPVTQVLRDNLRNSNPGNVIGALKGWVGMVRGGAIWDYKSDIVGSRVLDQGGHSPDIKLGGNQVNYQAVANINYGAMAAEIGLPQWVAEAGAGAFQIKDHWRNPTGNIGPLSTWFDDPADNYWIRFGYSYGASRSGNMTSKGFTKYMNDYITKHGEPPEPLSPGY